MYKLIKGNLTTFVENLNELPDCNIISFCCSNDGSLLVALVKITKKAIEDAAKVAETLIKAEKATKAKALEEAKKAEKEALKKKLADMEAEEKIVE